MTQSNLRVAVRLTPGVTREASVSVCQEVTDLGYRMRMDDVDTGERLGSLQYANEGGTLRFWALQAVNPSVARAMVEAAKQPIEKIATGQASLHRGINLSLSADGLLEAHDRGGMPAVHQHIANVATGAAAHLRESNPAFNTVREGVGVHWSSDPRIANQFAHGDSWAGDHDHQPQTGIDSYGGVHVPVVMHGTVDSAHHVTDHEKLRDSMVQDHGWQPLNADHKVHESETLVAKGAPVHISHVEASLPTSPNWIHQVRRAADSFGAEGSLQNHQHAWQRISGPIEKTATVLTDWKPNQRLFAPTKGDVDPRLFDESTRQMLPRVRSEILSLTDGFFASHGYGVRPSWARVFLAGSQASEWWGNRDFDILIGINYPLFRDARPQDAALSDKEVDDRFNVQLRDDFNDDAWHPDFDPDEAWSRTGYVNHDSWHIAKIHPYAAYDVTDGEWAVTPIHEPQGHTFADSEWYYFEGFAEQARHALALTGSARTQACSRLWEFVHSDRSRAFGPGGSGAFDYRNALEKYLSQCSVNQANTESNSDDDSLMQALANVRYGKEQKTAGRPAGYVPLKRAHLPLDSLVTSRNNMEEVLHSGRKSDTPGEPIYVAPSESHEGKYEILDGHHRVADAIRNGRTHVHALVEHQPDEESYPEPHYDFSPHMGEQKTAASSRDGIRYEHSPDDRFPDDFHHVRAFDGDKQVGSISWDTSGNSTAGWAKGQVASVGVHPDYQRRGIATELWNRARAVDPDVHHSPEDEQTEDGSAWSARTAGLFGPSWYETAHDDDIDDHPAAAQIRGYMTHHTSPQGHVYRLTHDSSKYVTATYLGKGSNRIKKPQKVGYMTYFGGKANDQNNIEGRIHKVFVKPAHRRRGLASAMLDHARAMKKPGDDIEHSSALTEDGKAWSEKKASRTAGANGDLPKGMTLHFEPGEHLYYPNGKIDAVTHHTVTARVPDGEGGTREIGHMHLDSIADQVHLKRGGEGLAKGVDRPVDHVSVDDDYQRRGVANAMWNHAKSLGLNPMHSNVQFPDGVAWSGQIDPENTVRNRSPRTATIVPRGADYAAFLRHTAASDSTWDVTREHYPSGGSKFGERYTLSAKDANGEEQGWVRYHEPKRKGSPIHVEEVRGHAPGVASHLLNHMESLHPEASRTEFLGEKNRRHKNTPSHHDGEHGKPTDWDQHYDSLGDIHRGFSIRLDSHDARTVNSPDHPAADHVKALQDKVNESNAGIHWTSGLQEAKNFSQKHRYDPRTDIPVILHAQRPERKDIETRPGELFRNGVFPHSHIEKEVPVRRGRDVKLTGMSWKPDSPHPEADEDGWLHHTFAQPITKRARAEYLDLYHRTTPEAADSIVGSGGFTSKEHRHDGQPVYFSTHLHGGEGEGYGSAAVHVRIPERLADLDDEFPDGEQHYAVPSHKIRPEHIVGRVAARSNVATVEDDPARWGSDGWRAHEMKRSTLRETHRSGEYTYHHAPGPLNDDDEGYGNIYVTHGDDPHNVVGESYYGPHPGRQGHLELASRVAPEHRRKGVATGMYDFAERLTGKPTAPADVNSEQAQGFWRNRLKEDQ